MPINIGYPIECLTGDEFCDEGGTNTIWECVNGQYEDSGVPCSLTDVQLRLGAEYVSPAAIYLGASATAYGRITDAATGAGLANITVSVLLRVPGNATYNFYKNVVTDSAGYFQCLISAADLVAIGAVGTYSIQMQALGGNIGSIHYIASNIKYLSLNVSEAPAVQVSTSIQEFSVTPSQVNQGSSVLVTGYLRNASTGAGLPGLTVPIQWAPPEYENFVVYQNVVTDSTGKFTCTITGVSMTTTGLYSVVAQFFETTVDGITYLGSNRPQLTFTVISYCPNGVDVALCLGPAQDPAITGYGYYCEPGTNKKYVAVVNKECNWCYIDGGMCDTLCTPNEYLDPVVCQDGTVIYLSQCDADGYGTHQTGQVCPQNLYIDTALSLAVADATIVAGESVVLSGRLTTEAGAGLGGAPVEIWGKSPSNISFVKLATVVTDNNGYYTKSIVMNEVGLHLVLARYLGTAPTAKYPGVRPSETRISAYAGEWY